APHEPLDGRNLGAAVRAQLPEAPRRFDRRTEVQALVLRLLDQHHGLESVDVVDPLLLPLRRDLRLVRPVVELHLRDPGNLADLPKVELDLFEMLRQIDGFEKVDLSTDRQSALASPILPPAGSYKARKPLMEGALRETRAALRVARLVRGRLIVAVRLVGLDDWGQRRDPF